MTPHQDANNIFKTFAADGMDKYSKGEEEHGGGFWTAGAQWYSQQLHDELLDSASYHHHLSDRLKSINSLADLMLEKGIQLDQAAVLLKQLVGSHQPTCVLPS